MRHQLSKRMEGMLRDELIDCLLNPVPKLSEGTVQYTDMLLCFDPQELRPSPSRLWLSRVLLSSFPRLESSNRL